MTNYLKWQEKIITDFSENNINTLYHEGYLYTRLDKGAMNQTRSLRVDLSKFKLTSENRRVLKKTEDLELSIVSLPYPKYHWSIGKLAKNFYTTKFGKGIFSANKMKEILTNPKKSNFNRLFIYSTKENARIGYCVALETNELIHYCYPFYDLNSSSPNLGISMMLRAIMYVKKHGKKYMYLGSFQRPGDTYKLQFAGMEWWDGKVWKNDLIELKSFNIL